MKFHPTGTGFFELVGTADIVPYLLSRLAAKFTRSPAHTGSHIDSSRTVPQEAHGLHGALTENA